MRSVPACSCCPSLNTFGEALADTTFVPAVERGGQAAFSRKDNAKTQFIALEKTNLKIPH